MIKRRRILPVGTYMTVGSLRGKGNKRARRSSNKSRSTRLGEGAGAWGCVRVEGAHPFPIARLPEFSRKSTEESSISSHKTCFSGVFLHLGVSPAALETQRALLTLLVQLRLTLCRITPWPPAGPLPGLLLKPPPYCPLSSLTSSPGPGVSRIQQPPLLAFTSSSYLS